MGLKDCRIVFDNAFNTYYVGQTVTGRAEISVDSSKKVRGISICFRGEAATSWFIEETYTNNEGKQDKETMELTGDEEYFKTEYYLIGGQGEPAVHETPCTAGSAFDVRRFGQLYFTARDVMTKAYWPSSCVKCAAGMHKTRNSEIELPPGTHTYPFTCVLPPTLPSSFEGEFGYVRYTVKVVLDRPWKFDHEFKAAFTVISPLDLNQNPRLKQPEKKEVEKFFCCCWCKSGPLTCVVSIPYTGFVSGQAIPLTCEVDNISNVEVLNTHVSLQKNVTYHSQRPRREIKRISLAITEFQTEQVEAHASRTWNHKLVVPPLPPSNLANCNIIDLDYELLVEARVSGFHQNITCKIPITIGTVPLLETGSMGPPSAPITANSPPADGVVIDMNPPQNNAMPGWVGPGGTVYPNIGSPTYQESKFGTNSIQDKTDNQYMRFSNNEQKYSPMYPVFNYAATNQG